MQIEKRKVKYIQKRNLDQELKNRQPGEILMIYDYEDYIGCLGWEKEAWNRVENIVTEYVENKEDAEDCCERILYGNPCISIPIFIPDIKNDVVCFASREMKSQKERDSSLVIAVRSLKHKKSQYFTEYLLKYKGVVLCGTGEIFELLEQLFSEYQLPVRREKEGKKKEYWLVIEKSDISHGKIRRDLLEIACMENTRAYIEVKHQMKQKGIAVIIIRFPTSADIKLTKNERARQEKGITFTKAARILNWGSLYEQQELMELYQKSRDEMLQFKPMKISQEENNTLCLCGPCIVHGDAPAGDRFPEILYQHVLHDLGYKVETIVVDGHDSEVEKYVLEKSFGQQDCLAVIVQLNDEMWKHFQADIDINLSSFFQNRPENSRWFSDALIHTTGEGNRQLANYLSPFLRSFLLENSQGSDSNIYKQIEQIHLNPLEEEELEQYFEKIKPLCFSPEFSKSNRIGAIVMNCNPFTNGHRYLIEQAAKEMDGLYIFVVEEDLSIFPFADRIELVKKGLNPKLGNVKVIPSGRFILSTRTFASYFAKEHLQRKTVDATEDVAFFGQFIVPRLHINVRFFGEEPLDTVTRQYNLDMKRKLPYYGVEVREIPRLEISDDSTGEVISASRLREAWKLEDWDLLKKLAPPSTLEYLRSHDKTALFEREKQKRPGGIPEKRREQLAQIRELAGKTGMVILYGMGQDASGIAGFFREEERSNLLFCDKKAESGIRCFEGGGASYLSGRAF